MEWLKKFKIKWAIKILRQKKLEEWKAEKRKKWLNEGMKKNEIEKRLKVYKIIK